MYATYHTFRALGLNASRALVACRLLRLWDCPADDAAFLALLADGLSQWSDYLVRCWLVANR